MPTKGLDLIIDRGDLARTQIVEVMHPDPGPGEVLLRIDTLALTANTVTYGIASDALGYWQPPISAESQPAKHRLRRTQQPRELPGTEQAMPAHLPQDFQVAFRESERGGAFGRTLRVA